MAAKSPDWYIKFTKYLLEMFHMEIDEWYIDQPRSHVLQRHEINNTDHVAALPHLCCQLCALHQGGFDAGGLELSQVGLS